jgi:DNA repair protein RadC
MIRDLPADERPRERLRAVGEQHLSNAQLIAILLRTGVTGENVITMSNRLLSQFQGLAGLARASFSQICELHGISEAKACQVLAAMELGRRVATLAPKDRPKITEPEDVYNLFGSDMVLLRQERLRTLLLNSKNEVVGTEDVYQGTVNAAQVRIAEVLRPAIRDNCPSIIVVHNHPSGDPAPSPEDVLVTRRINQSAESMDIKLLDHIVIGERGFVSMKSRNLGF